MLREPIDFLYSSHSHLLYVGVEKDDNFYNFILKNNTKQFYINEIKRYLKYFDSKNIKIILLDDLKNNLEGAYKDLLCFLDVENTNFTPNFKLQNSNKKCIFPKIRKVIEHPILWKIPKTLLPIRLYNNIRDFLYKTVNSYKKREPVDKNFKKELMKKYKIEVIKLNKLLHKNNLINKNIDLIKLWGYDKI